MGWVCVCVGLQLLPGSSGCFGLVVSALELETCVAHISMQGGWEGEGRRMGRRERGGWVGGRGGGWVGGRGEEGG